MAIDEQKLAEHRAMRKEVLKERKAEDRAPRRDNKIAIDRTPEGLYWLRFIHGGSLPDELQGKFTSIYKLKTLIRNRYGSEEICQS